MRFHANFFIFTFSTALEKILLKSPPPMCYLLGEFISVSSQYNVHSTGNFRKVSPFAHLPPNILWILLWICESINDLKCVDLNPPLPDRGLINISDGTEIRKLIDTNHQYHYYSSIPYFSNMALIILNCNSRFRQSSDQESK